MDSDEEDSFDEETLEDNDLNLDDLDDVELIDCSISDDRLLSLSVRELNRQLKKSGLTKAQSNKMKQRRRTLKNRGYAASCRNKRLEVKDGLEEERVDVVGNIKRLKSNNTVLKQELTNLKDKYDELKAFAKQNNLILPKEFKDFVEF